MNRESRRLFSYLIFFVLLAGLSPVASGGAEPVPPEASGLFVDRVDVEVVDVEVVVEDRSGERVTGLGVEDFELLVDGKPVEITNFYAAEAPESADGALDFAARPESREAVGLAGLPKVPDERPLHLAVYIDHLNLQLRGQRKAVEHLRGFLRDRLQRGDRVMLAGFDGSLSTVTPFTSEATAVEEGLDALDATEPLGRRLESKRDQTYRSIILDMAAKMSGAFQSHARSYVAAVEHNNAVSVLGLETFVSSLAGLPGRKAVVYVGNGLQIRPGEEINAYLSANGLGGSRPMGDPRLVLRRVTRAAQAAQVTLFTVNAGGGVADGGLLSAEYPGLPQSPAGRVTYDRGRESNLQETLVDFARETGGRAVLNPADLGTALAEAARDFDVYYSLGYRPGEDGNDERHRLKVKVDRPGLRVYHRAAYVDKSEAERVADRVRATLLFDPGTNPLDVAVVFGAAVKTARDKYEVPVVFRIPVDGVTFLDQGDRHEARLRFYLIVQDPEGGISELQEIPYAVSVTSEELAAAAGKELGYATKILLRSGRPTVALGVWDEISGEESRVRGSIVVGDPGERVAHNGSR